mgnify:FL=1
MSPHAYTEDQLVTFFAGLKLKSTAYYSMGITRADFDKFKRVMARAGEHVEYVCVDVANGYHENFVQFIEKLRAGFPKITLAMS